MSRNAYFLSVCVLFLIGASFMASADHSYSKFGQVRDATLQEELLQVSATAIYRTAYYSINGTAWESFNLSGNNYQNNEQWLAETADFTTPKFSIGEHYLAVYACNQLQNEEGQPSWDCHNNKWQLLIINNSQKTTTILCDDNNPEVFFINTAADWDHINDENYNIFCVQSGNYQSHGNVRITSSGTTKKPRYVVLDKDNNAHPTALQSSERAYVLFTLDGASNWVFDRMACIDFTENAYCYTVQRNSSNNLFSRFYLENFNGGFLLRGTAEPPFPDNNTIQQSHLYKMSAQGLDGDEVAIILAGSRWNEPGTISNTKILDNEIIDCNDGIMLARRSEFIHYTNYPGTLIDGNEIYITTDIYSDCNGNQNPEGKCAFAENAIDLKGGSKDPTNPVIISNNYFSGYRRTDTEGGGSGSYGAAFVGHFGLQNLIITKNVVADSNRGIVFAAPESYDYSAKNVNVNENIIYNIGHSLEGTVEYANFFYSVVNATFERNIIVNEEEKSSRWFSFQGTEQDITVRCNNVVNAYQASGSTRTVSTVVENNNHYYTDIREEGDGVYYDDIAQAHLDDVTITLGELTNNPYSVTLPNVKPTMLTPSCMP